MVVAVARWVFGAVDGSARGAVGGVGLGLYDQESHECEDNV